ncbi:endonuclease/exonuclease/phosphatase family protein [Gelidibacter maritimus]|uniref:Endonuclease/exonuclease/phosphatase family protein n=1 Tax=Gelidibacter maritimus TaxID=2761487 RepID=A0A7W2M2M5_9FLAO|nr:endonuclease/exonuclease/phosphatase family protein [Gelidibacter maritimus]MBA6151516.1 endonuclease/exonuclease/phosphatase family protein [Gelidibacter maritimus]
MQTKQFLFFLLLASLLSFTSTDKRSIELVDQSNFNSSKGFVENLHYQDDKSSKYGSSIKIKLVSWNIRHLGRTKTPEDIFEIANILRDFDMVAIQEVVAKDPAGAQAVAKIADELNRMGSKWDYQISDPTKSPSVYISERYAFLWKTSKVSIINRAYLDKELEALCYREPFVAAFKAKGKPEPFYVVNYHSRKYTDRPEEEIIHFIDYPERLGSTRILIAGDFNLDEKHSVWKPFYRKGFKSALHNQRTTLRTKCKNGDYLSYPIDNVYYTSGIEMIQARSIDFINNCENLERAREISDHLPIYVEFGFK